ncbi:UDP diphosphate synthase [Methanosalsum natronophilum]|uniref:UDP diphosphate synthase n=2 Tax=Methanosalsum natronophilum TaxID=768733 RepID=A0A3R7VU42_9EURY|nr:undecaprenyl diphosphate synthase [Methanosalsum natronophilum]RQD89437.1 MAG: UDP diphosphate synthase [Methanosalsum natronophilum]
MISHLYRLYIKHRIMQKKEYFPHHITLVLSETDLSTKKGYKSLKEFIDLLREMDMSVISIYVDIIDTDIELKEEVSQILISQFESMVSKLDFKPKLTIYTINGDTYLESDSDDLHLIFSPGFGGKKEILYAMRSVLKKVEDGSIGIDDIDEDAIESELLIREEPDIIIRTHDKNLSDFLIWQSVYSELYFTDVSWNSIRDIDVLRIIRDYQKRQRRFGK